MRIVLYSTNCPRCQVLKRKLEEKGVDFELETNVDKMLDLGIEIAPVLFVDGNLMDFGKAIKWIETLEG